MSAIQLHADLDLGIDFDTESIFNNINISESQVANAVDILEGLLTPNMPPPPPPPPAVDSLKKHLSKRKKTDAAELVGLSRKRKATEPPITEIPINERNQPEPGQRTLCELPSVIAGCSENHHHPPPQAEEPMPKKKKTADVKKQTMDKIKSNVPTVKDFEYMVVKYKGFDTGFIICQDGNYFTLTTSMLNEMIRQSRDE